MLGGGSQRIGYLRRDESDLRLIPRYGERREHLKRTAHLRGAEILLEEGGGIDIDGALRQRFARNVVERKCELRCRVGIVEAGEGEPAAEVRKKMETEYGFNHQMMVDIPDAAKAYEITTTLRPPAEEGDI